MRKVFLSHSSKDKGYVEKVANTIGADNCIYDAYTFEEGMKTLDEIYFGLEETDIFVFFISEHSLRSEWVAKERNRAKNLLEKNSIKRFYPIIIDERIRYDDDRIPKWIKKNYNIKFIGSPIIASNRVRSRMREVVWEANQKLKDRNLFFVGRNEETAKFEERRANFDKPGLKCLNASSAFNGIGRKAFMTHVLKKGNIMKESYSYNLISLEKHESIEDFILKVSDLCSGKADLTKLTSMKMDEKVSLAIDLVVEMQRHNEFIFIDDSGVIVKPNYEMVDWFKEILDRIESKIVFGIASTYKLNTRNEIPTVFAIQMQELSQSERRLMLKEYCDLESIKIDNEKLKAISSILSGYPGQVVFVIQMIKVDGISKTLDQLDEVREYADDRAKVIIDQFVETNEKMYFLAFLSSFDFVSYEVLEKVYEKKSEYKEIMNQFLSVSICEPMGADGEYFRVNDVLKDEVSRRKLFMGDKLSSVFHNLVDCTVNDDFVHNCDLSQYYNVVRNKIITGEVDEKYIIPSHYLKNIVRHYNSRQYDKSSKLCKKIIDGGLIEKYDRELVDEIYYYYCQSLAREHDNDTFFDMIQYPGFKSEDKCFLEGFFYRINGNPNKAIYFLNKALERRPNFPKARRELANAYIAAEDYEAAEKLCAENYREDKNNPYYIQPYFKSLIHKYMISINTIDNKVDNDQNRSGGQSYGYEDSLQKMNIMLEDMKAINTPQAKQMWASMKAEYYTIVTKDLDRAVGVIKKELVNSNESSIYLYLSLFDIGYRFENDEIMRDALLSIEKLIIKQKYFSNAMYLRKARYYASKGDMNSAKAMLKKLRNMPDGTMEKLRVEIEEKQVLC